GHHLVPADFWRNEVRIRLVVLQQPVSELRQPEEVAFLGQPLDRIAAGGTAPSVEQLRFGNEKLVDRAVPALVRGLVEISAVGNPLPDRLCGTLVAFFGGAYEVVVRDIQQAGESPE